MAIERIADILDIEPKIKDAENAIDISGVKNNIKFKNVWFEYAEDRPVLKGIDFVAKAGTTTALVGNSGGGKGASTDWRVVAARHADEDSRTCGGD